MENSKKEDKESYYVYIILCENNSYYTGITNDLVNRFALSVEHYIKSMDKKVKTMFIENNRLLKSYYIKEMKNKKKDFNSNISIRSVSKKDIEHINNIFNVE